MKNNLKIILASASPRRLQILQEHGLLNVKAIPADIEEVRQPNENAIAYVTRLAKEKAEAILHQISTVNTDFIIAADTTVVCNNQILEKPIDNNDAYRMLNMLSGNIHKVFTGYALIHMPTKRVWKDCISTDIVFHKLSEQQIQDYINSGAPFDKAGAYGIQQVKESFVKTIVGSYYNVMGLPIEEILKKIDIAIQ